MKIFYSLFSKSSLLVLMFFVLNIAESQSQIINFDEQGRQVMRFSTTGDAVDAHDGEIAEFNGIYYLYGTSYDCGFEWGNKGAPFCGFKVYSSSDLKTWTDRGYLFDATTQVWQSRCDGKTYGCFRPHVIYNKKTQLYVLWINVYDNVVGYRVFTSKTPVGPFVEQAEPKLAVNSTMPAAGLNNGDHDTFVDDDGTAYLAYTDWRAKGAIVVEQLSNDYLTGTGKFVEHVTPNTTEAPGMFKRNGVYYVLYSDPNCGYCSGTGTSYRTATHPLGPWSDGKKISDNSCGGQPSFVSTIKVNNNKVYLYGSDLWNNAAKNEALANYYWAPILFNADGSIKPFNCADSYRQPKQNIAVGNKDITTTDSILSGRQQAQPYVAMANRRVKTINLVAYKNHNPNAALVLSVYAAGSNSEPIGHLIYSAEVPAASIGWSVKKVKISVKFALKKGKKYVFVLHSDATEGYYGLGVKNSAENTTMLFSTNGGKDFLSSKKQQQIVLEVK